MSASTKMLGPVTDALVRYVSLANQRRVGQGMLCLVFAVLVYWHLSMLLWAVGLLTVLWYAWDAIDDATATSIDPSGKYVFITGCDSGFGLESAKVIRDMGFHVIAGCYDEGSEGAKELKARPWVKKVEVVHLDVTSEGSVKAALKEVKDICTDQGLWAVISNAGQNSLGPAELMPMSSFQRVAEVNLLGAVRVIKGCLPLIRQAKGRVVSVSSERAYNHTAYSTAYCLAKAGLHAFSDCLRLEMLEHGVKVITVVPGQFGLATAICDSKLNQGLVEPVLTEHSKLSLTDQRTAYPLDKVKAIYKRLERDVQAKTASTSPKPVVQAYVAAVTSKSPRPTYLVHGTPRMRWDPDILMLRLRPFLPQSVADVVDRLVHTVL